MRKMFCPVAFLAALFVLLSSCAKETSRISESCDNEGMLTLTSSDLELVDSDINTFANQLADVFYPNFDFNFTITNNDIQTRSNEENIVLDFQSEGNEPFQVVCNSTPDSDFEYGIVQNGVILKTFNTEVSYTDDGNAIVMIVETNVTKGVQEFVQEWGECFSAFINRPFMVTIGVGMTCSSTCRIVYCVFAGVAALGCMG